MINAALDIIVSKKRNTNIQNSLKQWMKNSKKIGIKNCNSRRVSRKTGKIKQND